MRSPRARSWTRLKAMKVPYQLDAGGRAIRVQSDRVDELRLELTSEGMPASGRIGFEIFDRTAFGATEFLEHVNYRRALEGEIARTVATLAEVSAARVHISMAKDSLFGEQRPAKASVVLKLRGHRPLAQPTVAGIANLVAASVEGLVRNPSSFSIPSAVLSRGRRKTPAILSGRHTSNVSNASNVTWPPASSRCSNRWWVPIGSA